MIDVSPEILDSARVGDCMRAGIFTCDPHASLRELAATMASLRVHALALRAPHGQRMPIITDLEVMAGLALSDRLQAGDPIAYDGSDDAKWPARTRSTRPSSGREAFFRP